MLQLNEIEKFETQEGSAFLSTQNEYGGVAFFTSFSDKNDTSYEFNAKVYYNDENYEDEEFKNEDFSNGDESFPVKISISLIQFDWTGLIEEQIEFETKSYTNWGDKGVIYMLENACKNHLISNGVSESVAETLITLTIQYCLD